ncbi:hypothetical protein OG21DRAFT_1365185, partial [Imleria badia]
LRKFELGDDEWEIAEQLGDISRVLKDATAFFSRSTPNLAAVIPAMDHIDFVLASFSLDHKYSLAIQVAMGTANKALNRYYKLTDSSESYRISMILHPQHKLQYFENARWEVKWIDMA